MRLWDMQHVTGTVVHLILGTWLVEGTTVATTRDSGSLDPFVRCMGTVLFKGLVDGCSAFQSRICI